MSDYYQLTLQERKTFGTSASRNMRRKGDVPVNYYYTGQDNVNLFVDSKELYHALHSGQRVFEVIIAGETQYVMMKELQFHPVTDDVIHVDVMRVRRDQKMTITVPIQLEGDAAGVKEGGVLSQLLTSIEIECLPTDVPKLIPLDVSDLELNNSLTIKDVSVGDGITVLTAEDQVIATITIPEEEEELEVELEEGEEEGEEGEEGEADDKETGEKKSDGDSKDGDNAE